MPIRTITNKQTLHGVENDDQRAASGPQPGLARNQDVARRAAQVRSARQVQAKGRAAGADGAVREAAEYGLAQSSEPLPHLARIQASFGRHDVGGVQAHVGGAAAEAATAMGAEAYATGQHVSFARAPDLHTAAHEAAHVIQQRNGVQLKGGVGSPGDGYERHADAVADAVVAKRSAEPLLDEMAGRGSEMAAVQHKRNKAFDTITKKGLKKRNAPRVIELPPELVTGMQKAWDKSLPGGKPKEHGGNLVRKRNGRYGWRPGEPGDKDGFMPDDEDVGPGGKLIGIGHTHPYSKKEGGDTGVSFGKEDISSIVHEDQPLNIVQSGKTLFVIARTKEFEALLKGLDDDGLDALEARVEKCWETVFNATKGSFAYRVHMAAKATCKEFHLVYYCGTGSTLRREV